MSIEKITLDMLARIMALEERVAKLEENQSSLSAVIEQEDEATVPGSKESGRQKPESDRHRWQRDDCPNLQQVLV